MAESTLSHGTMEVLLLSLERRDDNQLSAARAVLRSAVQHLFETYRFPTNESSDAMCTLLVHAAEVGR